ncbi:MAG: elongation factor P maturation arginine rhamnosyltransferase EarP, partial [Fluviibacter sp.]
MNDHAYACQHWDIFCRVIDNFGDAGVCWRLAADLASRGQRVRLFIDQPDILP